MLIIGRQHDHDTLNSRLRQQRTHLAHGRARLGMAYVPQGREIFAALSARDNLRMGLVKTGARAAPRW